MCTMHFGSCLDLVEEMREVRAFLQIRSHRFPLSIFKVHSASRGITCETARRRIRCMFFFSWKHECDGHRNIILRRADYWCNTIDEKQYVRKMSQAGEYSKNTFTGEASI